jgi:predicted O-linked N-acetylglucosamine transferase (SPINDLY family)
MTQHSNQPTFSLALRHHQAGRLDEAERLYRQVLVEEPRSAGAMHYLGVIAHQAGRSDAAIELIRRSIAIQPDYAEAHNNLGNILKDCGKRDDAMASYGQAIASKPDYATAHYNVGLILKDQGRIDDAIAAFRRAIALHPGFAEAQNQLGAALNDKGQSDEAAAACLGAIAARPGYAEAHFNLGIALTRKGMRDQAIGAFRRAIALRPDDAQAHNKLGVALGRNGAIEQAIDELHRAIAIKPDFADAFYNLGVAQRRAGRLDDEISAYRRAIALDPDYTQAYANLGVALLDQGRAQEAIAASGHAVASRPDLAEPHGNLVLAIHYHPQYTARAIARELSRWNERHAEPLRQAIVPHSNDRGCERSLRIGYVSPDFREHVLGRSLLPLFANHDRGQFQIICYAQVNQPDDTTCRFQQCADCWRDIVGLSDEQLARQIREDRIDVLVDLAMHTPPNRLPAFARKPAPVQVCWLAYPGSTGLRTMDYRLSDPFLDPPGTDESVYSERTIRLPDSFWCYGPGPAPDPAPAPCSKSGAVTFGCLNKFAKASDAALDLWARTLAAVPGSRIIIHALPCSRLAEIVERFRLAGVEKDRLRFVGKQPWSSYVRMYSEIDICLDPFPWGGGITTCDALWMGVPVVTLSGDTAVGRGGRSILSNLGLPELVAYTQDQYIKIAVDLARRPEATQALRQSMRSRMLASPLMNAAKFARDVEAAYRRMWKSWCQAAPAGS